MTVHAYQMGSHMHGHELFNIQVDFWRLLSPLLFLFTDSPKTVWAKAGCPPVSVFWILIFFWLVWVWYLILLLLLLSISLLVWTFSRGCLISSLLLRSPPLIHFIPILISTLISSLTLLIFLAFLPLVTNILAHTVMVLFLYCSKILFEEAIVFGWLLTVLPRWTYLSVVVTYQISNLLPKWCWRSCLLPWTHSSLTTEPHCQSSEKEEDHNPPTV